MIGTDLGPITILRALDMVRRVARVGDASKRKSKERLKCFVSYPETRSLALRMLIDSKYRYQ